MKRTTAFLTDALDRLLVEIGCRTHPTQAEIVRDALVQYLRRRTRPWPRSIGAVQNFDGSVTSNNVKGWVHERWRQDREVAGQPSSAVY